MNFSEVAVYHTMTCYEMTRCNVRAAALAFMYSSNDGAAEIDWRGSDSFTNGSGSRVSAMPPLPSSGLRCNERFGPASARIPAVLRRNGLSPRRAPGRGRPRCENIYCVGRWRACLSFRTTVSAAGTALGAWKAEAPAARATRTAENFIVEM